MSLHQVVGYEPIPLEEPDIGLTMLELEYGPPVLPVTDLDTPPPMDELETTPRVLLETPPPYVPEMVMVLG